MQILAVREKRPGLTGALFSVKMQHMKRSDE